MIDPKIAPALQQHAEELKKSQLEDVLNSKLEHRPPASELIDHNILHGSQSTPFSPLPPRTYTLFSLRHVSSDRICSREHCTNLLPDFYSSIFAYVFLMVESNVAPGLQKQAEELKRSQLVDKLEGKLDTRPRPSELVEQHILHGMFQLQISVRRVISWST